MNPLAQAVRDNKPSYSEGDPRWNIGYNFITAMGMTFPEVSDDGRTFVAAMPAAPFVGQRTGRLAGGAAIAFAETTAGRASNVWLGDEKLAVGQSVTASHLSSQPVDGSILYARGTCLHQGKRTHVWEVRIENEAGRLVSLITVTNAILDKSPLA